MGERWTPAYARLFDPDHELRGEPVCRAFAWLDLCHLAQRKDTTRLVGTDPVELSRGELIASVRFLAERWSWSKSKVQRFLEVLQDPKVRKLATVSGTPSGTVYRVVRYGDYALGWDSNRDTGGTPAGRARDKHYIEESTQPSAPAREAESDVENHTVPGAGALIDWLGEYENGVVGRFMAVDDANGGAVRSIQALYASGSMTAEAVWGSAPEAERKLALAATLETFAGEQKRYQAKFFRMVLRDRVAELRDPQPVARRHDYGDETERDRKRAEAAKKRSARRTVEEQDRATAKARKEAEELEAWYEGLEPDTRQAVDEQVRAKLEGMGSVGAATTQAVRYGVWIEVRKRGMPATQGEMSGDDVEERKRVLKEQVEQQAERLKESV